MPKSYNPSINDSDELGLNDSFAQYRSSCHNRQLTRPVPMATTPGSSAATRTRTVSLVPFPLEYALYRISVSPVNHSRASRNPELEAAFQYQQIVSAQ